MEILKRQETNFYVNDKKFKTEEEASNYIDMQIRAKDLRRKIEPFVKEFYVDKNNFYEDLFLALSNNKDEVIDIIERAF